MDWLSTRRRRALTSLAKELGNWNPALILGAHLVGPHADEVINVFALAIRHGLTADDLKQTIFAYPSGESDIGSML